MQIDAGNTTTTDNASIFAAYDPWGELMADAGGYDGTGTSGILDNSQSNCSPVCVPSIITADIDLEKLESVRERMPVQQHRDNSSFSC